MMTKKQKYEYIYYFVGFLVLIFFAFTFILIPVFFLLLFVQLFSHLIFQYNITLFYYCYILDG